MKIAVFSPYSFVKQWRLTDLYLANILDDKDNRIFFLECRGYQKTCVAMLCAGLDWNSNQKDKNEVCNQCKNFTEITSSSQNTNRQHIFLDNLISKNDKKIINTKILRYKNSKDFLFRGINIGEAVLYSLLIENQFTSFSEVKRNCMSAFIEELKTGLQTVLIGEKFFENYKPDIFILHNGLYATGNILSQIAKKNCCEVYTHTNGSNRHLFDISLRIAKGNFYEQIKILKDRWQSDMKITSNEKDQLKNHLETLKKANTLYSFSCKRQGSLPRWLRSKIKNRKTALLTMSSYDELVGAKILGYKKEFLSNQIFQNQTEWVKETIKLFRKNKDLFLILRPHPREFPNPRTRAIKPTTHITHLLNSVKKTLPENVFINLPDQKISIYDLFDYVNIVINGWSTAGEEAALMGKSVITVFPEFANIPKSLCSYPQSRTLYEKQICKTIKKKFTIKINTTNMLKWKNFSINRCEECCPNMIQIAQNFERPKKLLAKILSKFNKRIYFNKYIDDQNLRKNSSKIKKLLSLRKNFLFEV